VNNKLYMSSVTDRTVFKNRKLWMSEEGVTNCKAVALEKLERKYEKLWSLSDTLARFIPNNVRI
jgi:hypothetical protein